MDPQKAKLIGEIVSVGLQMSQRPGVQKMFAAAQEDQDVALAVQNLSGVDVHESRADMIHALQGMSIKELEEKKASMDQANTMLGIADPLLNTMSPQAFSSVSTLINGGMKLANFDASGMESGFMSMLSGGKLDFKNMLQGLPGLGDIGQILTKMMNALFSLIGGMFGKMESGGALLSASTSNHELTGDMAEVMKLQPGANGKSPQVAQFYSADGKPAVNDAQFNMTAAQRTALPPPGAQTEATVPAQPG
jgi:hypothetical protein